jgi:small subunit ribosomal protein S17
MARILIGKVSSDKPDKSIVVTVVTHKTHPIYKKRYISSKKFMAHDEKNEAKTGDKVSIIETRPISAKKRFVLKEIIEKPALRDEIAGGVPENIATKPVEKPQPSKSAKKTKVAATTKPTNTEESEE